MSPVSATVCPVTYEQRKSLTLGNTIRRNGTELTTRIVFTLDGTPVPKGRPRFTGQGRAYTPTKTRVAESQILAAYLAVAGHLTPHDGPVTVDVEFVFTPPASWPKWKRASALTGDLPHTSKPDLDNLFKIIDGLNGHAWRDDSQIFRATPEKRYGDHAMTRVAITFHPAPPTRKETNE